MWPPSCIKYCNASPPHGMHQICCEMLPHSSTKAPASSKTFLGGMALALTFRSNRSQMCSMGLRSVLFTGHDRTLTFLSCRKSRTEQSSMAGSIVVLERHVRMSLQEGYHMREEDVFPVTHSIEIACNDNKLSSMM